MSLVLLQTKLYAPPLRPRLVSRSAVTTKLRVAVTHPLTLIAAPAGFGKTTLVSEWIAQTEQPVAWLSLDDDDNDIVHFFTYLVAALRTVDNEIGASVHSVLQAPQPPPAKALLTQLINDLNLAAQTLILVLDDYHLITAQAIHEALTFFIEHLPPTLRLIFTSRIDPPLPLARWRVRGQLAEVRADDLRFSREEATIFLNQMMGLQLTAADIIALETRTEGWIAGLQLAALSLEGRDDVASFIQAFSGSHRHVLSYLVEEVLNRCPAATLDFLLQTAILEQLNADLCNAVTGKGDSQTLLEQIEQANLFLVPLDDDRQWYRYHHLFADVLRSRLQQTHAQAILPLHQRASEWHEQQERWSEAIHHALAADDFARATRLIERVGIAFFAQPNIQHSLQRWLSTLPVAFIHARPRLCLMYAWIHFAHADTATALRWVAQAEATLQRQVAQRSAATGKIEGDPELDPEIAAEVVAMRAVLTAYDRTLPPDEALAYGQQALATLRADAYSFRGMAAAAMGMAYVKQGDVLGAEAAMTEAARMSRATGNLYMHVAFVSSQIVMQRARGLLRHALATAHENLAWLHHHSAAAYPTFGSLYLTLADLLREQNELDAAHRYAETAITHSDQELNPAISVFSRLVLMRIKQAQEDWPPVWALLAEVSALVEQHPEVLHRTILPAITAQLQMAEGVAALETVWAWAQNTSWEEGKLLSAYRFIDFVYLYEHSRIARAQVFIAWARRTSDQLLLRETLAYLQRQAQIAEASNLGWYLVKLRLLQALTYHALGEVKPAVGLLSDALVQAEAEGFVRIFLDEGEPVRLLILDFRFWLAKQASVVQQAGAATYADKLLAAFPGHEQTTLQPELVVQLPIQNPKSKIQNLVEPLSNRELEVLQLIAAGLSNQEIAARLVVTVGTVKSHVNHLFGKLAVTSRTQAVARARELGLLTG
jgi:LuxR family maltose regulon positive regulatory protein